MDNNKLVQEWQAVPAGSKLLRTEVTRGDAGSATSPVNTDMEESKVRSFWGVYRTPLQFLDWAKQLKHPRAGSSGLDDVLIKAVFSILTEGCAAIAAKRAKVFSHWLRRAVALADDEKALRASMNQKCQKSSKESASCCFKKWPKRRDART